VLKVKVLASENMVIVIIK